MALETATYISGLDASNPVHTTDPVSEGDDHIRLLKSTLLATMANITGAVTASHTELNHLDGVTGTTGAGDMVLAASPTLTGTCTITGSLGVTGNVTGSIDAMWLLSGTLVDDRVAESNVTQHQTALTVTKSQISDFGSPLYSGDTATTLNIGSTDTTLTRDAAGQIAVEGDAVFSHNDGAYVSAKIFFSSATEPTTEGSNGDIFLVY